MKVIFLDIDGVLNTSFTEEYTSSNTLFIEDEKLKILKEIVDKTGAKVVLISSWRLGWKFLELGVKDNYHVKDFIELRKKFNDFGINLYDKTPIFGCSVINRDKEIKTYIDKSNVNKYVIIDDEYLENYSYNLVLTSKQVGLEKRHIKKIEEILNK